MKKTHLTVAVAASVWLLALPPATQAQQGAPEVCEKTIVGTADQIAASNWEPVEGYLKVIATMQCKAPSTVCDQVSKKMHDQTAKNLQQNAEKSRQLMQLVGCQQ